MTDAEARKRMRVEILKQARAQQTVKPSSLESQKRSEMNMVELIRTRGRETLLDKAKSAGVDFSFQIDAVPGKA